MYCVTGFLFVTLIGIATSYDSYSLFLMQPNACDATVVPNSYGTILQGCPTPSIYGGSFPTTVETDVTNPATVKKVNINWFLNEARDPSLIVTLEANSTASAQEYTLNIMAESFSFPIYCGRISTVKPEQDEPQTQTISVQISCLRNTLTPTTGVVVAAEVKGQASQSPFTKSYRLPNCENDLEMHNSNQCVEERNKRINFALEQRGNAVDVILQAQTAYRFSAQVYVMIAERITTTSFLPWKAIGRERLLTLPTRMTSFSDLNLGATYQVTIWRPNEPAVRYENIITLKYDRKLKGSTNFMRRLLDSTR